MVVHNIKIEKKPGEFFVEDFTNLKRKKRQKRDENRDLLKCEAEIEVKKSERIIFLKIE
jgi:hypothetical protein